MASNFIEYICQNHCYFIFYLFYFLFLFLFFFFCYFKTKIPDAKSESQKSSEGNGSEMSYNSKNKSHFWNRQANIESVVQECVNFSDTQPLKQAR